MLRDYVRVEEISHCEGPGIARSSAGVAVATALQLDIASEIASPVERVLRNLSSPYCLCERRIAEKIRQILGTDELFIVFPRDNNHRVVVASSDKLWLVRESSAHKL